MYNIPLGCWSWLGVAVGISKHSSLSQYFNNLFHSAFHLSDPCALYYFHTHACTVGETSNTTVGSTTDNSSATTVPPMHSPAPHITSLPSVYQPLPSELQQQPQTATPSQLQQSVVHSRIETESSWLGRAWASPTLAWLHCKTCVYVCLRTWGHIPKILIEWMETKVATPTFQSCTRAKA